MAVGVPILQGHLRPTPDNSAETGSLLLPTSHNQEVGEEGGVPLRSLCPVEKEQVWTGRVIRYCGLVWATPLYGWNPAQTLKSQRRLCGATTALEESDSVSALESFLKDAFWIKGGQEK